MSGGASVMADGVEAVAALAPFRGGRGGMRMGLKPLPPGEDGFNRSPERIAEKRAALEAHPDAVRWLPEAEPAIVELASLLAAPAPTLDAAARSVGDDLCLLLPDGAGDEGVHRLVGGAMAFPTDWHLADKLGLPLGDVHAPIAAYGERLAGGVDHFLRALEPGPVYQRANWFVAETARLRWFIEKPAAERFAGADPARAWVRCERQTLRRLPQSGAVLFTIDVQVAPLLSLPHDLRLDLAAAARTLVPSEFVRREAADWLPVLDAAAAAP